MGSINGCRVRCLSDWSMVPEEDAVDRCPASKISDAVSSSESSNTDSTDSVIENKNNKLVSLFRSLLESFLDEFCSSDSFRPLPPMTGDGRSVDLLNLFINVSYRGGFDSISENCSWGEVAEESGFGLGFNNSASAKLIYVKYIVTFARWLNRVFTGDINGTSLELSGISDDLLGKLKAFLFELKRKYKLRKGGESGAELQWFISKTKRRYDKEIQGSKMVDKRLEKLMNLDPNNQECSSPLKRKRECSLETLKWLRKVAKDPFDLSIGSLPDRSKWGAYGNEEPWKLLLLFRASRTNTDPASEKIWQKLQKMHPSLYDDSAGPSYNLRQRLAFDGSQFNGKKATNGMTSNGNGSASDSSDEEDRSYVQVGKKFQAEVPEWTGITSESDSKWLGTKIWPLSKEENNSHLLIERDPIGKGRQVPCGCQNPSSIECVRFHITTKQEKLKLELGPSFFSWSIHIMGEGTLQYWSSLDLKKLNSLMASPPTISSSFFDKCTRIISSKRRSEIVSYFYNVALLQFRANQNRISPYEADSDTDHLYKDPITEENINQKPVMLSPKKKRRR